MTIYVYLGHITKNKGCPPWWDTTALRDTIFQKAQRPGVMAEALLGIQSGNWEGTFDDGKFSTRSSHP